MRRNELIRFRGSLVCLNTLESLKRLDKNAHLDEECLPDLLRACGVLPPERRKQGGGEGEDDEEQEVQGEDGEEEDPCAALAATACVAHCDLKSNVTVYWFAFPCLVPRPGKAVSYSPPGGGGSEGGGLCRRWTAPVLLVAVGARLSHGHHPHPPPLSLDDYNQIN